MPRPHHTHTVVTLEVSPACYNEIARLLRDAQYDHVFDNGMIDMTGIGLVMAASPTIDHLPADEADRVALYHELVAGGLSDHEARDTAWPPIETHMNDVR